MIMRAWLWLRSVLFRARLEREMDEEISTHLGRAIESVSADLRYAGRCLSRTPFSALTMIVVFALGIGVNATLFLFISSLVNSPLPGMSRDDSLVRIRGIERRSGRSIGREFSYPEFRDYASQKTLFASVTAWTSSDVVLGLIATNDGQDRLFNGAATYVTANYFKVLGVEPVSGPGLPVDTPDAGGEPPLVAVISHVVWERCFAMAPDIVGRPLKVNDLTVTIAGVAPKRFFGARTGGSQMRVWVPLSSRPLLQRTTTDLTSYDAAFLGLAARLQPGIQSTQALATVEAIGARSMQLMTGPQSAGVRSTDVVPVLASNYFPPSGETPDTIARAGSLVIPLLILLVTCTNVSALQAGLALARRHEIAVRLTLGASRRRIVRQLVTESVLLAVTAGALALFVIWILLRFVESNVADVHVVIDWRTILFTLVVALVAGVVFGLSPALHGTRVSLSEVLKDSSVGVIGRSRLQSGLVVAQIALTQPLLLGMGALILEMRDDLGKVPSTVYADRVVDVRFNTNPRYGTIDQAREDRLRHLQDRFAAIPGIVAIVPQENADDSFDVAAHHADDVGADAGRRRLVRVQAAPPGYFSLIGIPIVLGRDFQVAPREDPTAIVIGAAAARRLWPGADPIGRRLVALSPTRRGSVFTVVGLVDETGAGLRDDGDEIRAFVADVRVTGHFLVRTQAPAQPMLPMIRTVAATEAPDLPIVSVRTLDAIASEQRTSLTRILGTLTGTGAMALFLSAIGLYAVVAFAVRQRVREIGIRMALGGDRRQLVRWFVMHGLKLSAVGMVVGLTLSVIVVRLMAAVRGEEAPSGLFGLAAAVACVAIAAALVATWIPSRRAAEIDPLLALRVE